MKNRVLITLDGSAFSRKIMASVIKLFPAEENDLVLLQVAALTSGVVGCPPQPVSEAITTPMYQSARDLEYAQHPIYATQEWENHEAAVKDELEIDAQQLRAAGYTVSTAVHTGNAAIEIVKFIQNENVDALAMTTHSRSGISGVILGSVAHQVLRHSPVPVLLLHPSE